MDVRRSGIAALLAALVAVSFGWSAAALASEPDCTKTEERFADRWLWLSPTDKQLSIEQHLPWGVPTSVAPVSNERLLVQRDYVINYDGDLRAPVWTAERVVAASLGKAKRSDCFRADIRLPSTEASEESDYAERIFDQGHMSPSANMTRSKLAVHNSFVLSNMTPQFCQFNRGIWQIFEELTRRWAEEHETVYVFNGSVFDRNADGLRDDDATALRMKSNNGKRRVAIPSAFYKVVAVREPSGATRTLTVLLPHDQTDLDGTAAVAYLQAHITNIAAIKAQTGLNFFPSTVSDVTESTAIWPFSGAAPRSLARIGTQCRNTAGAVVD